MISSVTAAPPITWRLSKTAVFTPSLWRYAAWEDTGSFLDPLGLTKEPHCRACTKPLVVMSICPLRPGVPIAAPQLPTKDDFSSFRGRLGDTYCIVSTLPWVSLSFLPASPVGPLGHQKQYGGAEDSRPGSPGSVSGPRLVPAGPHASVPSHVKAGLMSTVLTPTASQSW